MWLQDIKGVKRNFYHDASKEMPNEVMPLRLVDCRYFGASLTQQNQWLLRHTPAFSAREVGYWDQDKVLLTVQMISTVQIYAGVLSWAVTVLLWLAQF